MKIIRKYHDGHSIIQLELLDDNIINVNLSLLGKSIGHDPQAFLQLQPVKDYLAWREKYQFFNAKSVDAQTTSKGIEFWAEEGVAIQFARWINPAIEIHLRKCIKDFLKSNLGYICFEFALIEPIEYHEVRDLLIEAKMDQMNLIIQNEALAYALEKAAIKNQLFELQLIPDTFSDNEMIAEEIGLAEPTLVEILLEKGIIYMCE